MPVGSIRGESELLKILSLSSVVLPSNGCNRCQFMPGVTVVCELKHNFAVWQGYALSRAFLKGAESRLQCGKRKTTLCEKIGSRMKPLSMPTDRKSRLSAGITT